jgi:hypothetical protein
MSTFVIDIDHVQIAAPKACEAEARDPWGNRLEFTEPTSGAVADHAARAL